MKPLTMILAAVMSLIVTMAEARTVSPKDFGLASARTGTERFEVLKKTHTYAAETNAKVSYRGIGRLEIEIPKGAKSIPLSAETDFGGVEMVVTNHVTNYFTLFALKQELKPLSIDKALMDMGDFRSVSELRRGKKIVVITDMNPWVENRRGYSYGATRKDILYVKRGRAQGRVIAPYNNAQSNPKVKYCDVSGTNMKFRNLVFTRTPESDKVTRLVVVENQNDVTIENVTINTPESELYGDCAISIQSCTNVQVRDVRINGTYSLPGRFGYGIGMNNVWNSHFVRLNAHGNWGIFGNNNVNKARLEDCDINRFDVHCYGRDVYCSNTTFRKQYNQFSSFYGELTFEDCKFLECVPVLFETSYDAYTYFQLAVRNCEITVDKARPYLIMAGNPSTVGDKARAELREPEFPDVELENVTVTLPEGVDRWTLFQVSNTKQPALAGISRVKMAGVRVSSEGGKPAKVAFSNRKIETKKAVDIMIQNSNFEEIVR